MDFEKVHVRNKEQVSVEHPLSKTLDFTYVDSDHFLKEISEIYAFSEEQEFFENKNSFYHLFGNRKWNFSVTREKENFLLSLLDKLEQKGVDQLGILKAILYLCQGVFEECHSEYDIEYVIKENCRLLYKKGYFTFVCQLLGYEISKNMNPSSQSFTDKDCNLETNIYFRILISITYTIMEVMRNYKKDELPEYYDMWQQFKQEFIEIHLMEREPLLLKMMDLVNKFCLVYSPQLPIKRVTLYIWKSLLYITGGMPQYYQIKKAKFSRFTQKLPKNLQTYNYNFVGEDSVEIISQIKPFNLDVFPFSLLNNRANILEKSQMFLTGGTLNKSNFSRIGINNNTNKPVIYDQEDKENEDNTLMGPPPPKRNLLVKIRKEPLTEITIDMQKNEPRLELTQPDPIEDDTYLEVTMKEHNSEGTFLNGDGTHNMPVYRVNEPSRNNQENNDDNNETSQSLFLVEHLDTPLQPLHMPSQGNIEFDNSFCQSITTTDISTNLSDMTLVEPPKSVVVDGIYVDLQKIGQNEEGGEEEEDGEDLAVRNILCENVDVTTTNLVDEDEEDDEIRQDPFELEDDTSDMNASTLSSSSTHSFTSQRDKITSLIDKKLPWKSKVRKSDLLNYLNKVREKFFGFTLPDDITTLSGIPQPIQESYKILKNHLYVPISEMEAELEENKEKYPYLYKDEKELDTNMEMMYELLLPNISSYLVGLLKILLAASPIPKAKTEAINIQNDVIPKDIYSKSRQELCLLESDIKRHKAIIAKAVSSILFLFMKHLKVNHVYQFENCSQILTNANCIALILKYLNQELMTHITNEPDRYYTKSDVIEFENTNVTSLKIPLFCDDKFHSISQGQYNWRNLFSCVNLVRTLNMLIKRKPSRIMSLIGYGAAPILRKSLRVKSIIFQYYVLKCLKPQMKYLGRQWRKNNMSIVSAIYQCIRHHLLDDWAYGNHPDVKPWEVQNDDIPLRKNILAFHARKYPQILETLLSPNYNNKCNEGMVKAASCDSNNIKINIDYDISNNGTNDKNLNSFNVIDTTTVVANGCNSETINFTNSGTSGVVGVRLQNEYNYGIVNIKKSEEDNNDTACMNYLDLLKYAQTLELSHEFKCNYKKWLQHQVYNERIPWDTLLEHVTY